MEEQLQVHTHQTKWANQYLKLAIQVAVHKFAKRIILALIKFVAMTDDGH
jgi:hypothetical protein